MFWWPHSHCTLRMGKKGLVSKGHPNGKPLTHIHDFAYRGTWLFANSLVSWKGNGSFCSPAFNNTVSQIWFIYLIAISLDLESKLQMKKLRWRERHVLHLISRRLPLRDDPVTSLRGVHRMKMFIIWAEKEKMTAILPLTRTQRKMCPLCLRSGLQNDSFY